MAKIDRHELKKDEFAEEISTVYSYVTENPTKVLMWAIIVIVVVGGALGYYSYHKKMKKNATEKLGLVYIMLDAGQYNEALDTVKVIIDRYSGTDAAKIAKYLLGHINYAFGYLDSAITAYEDFLKVENPDSDLAAAALFGIGICYEDKGQYKKAIEYYQKVLKEYPNFFRNDEVMLSIARCYDVMGDFDNAIKYYEELVKKYPDTQLYQRASVLLARAKSRAFAYFGGGKNLPKPQESAQNINQQG